MHESSDIVEAMHLQLSDITKRIFATAAVSVERDGTITMVSTSTGAKANLTKPAKAIKTDVFAAYATVATKEDLHPPSALSVENTQQELSNNIVSMFETIANTEALSGTPITKFTTTGA